MTSLEVLDYAIVRSFAVDRFRRGVNLATPGAVILSLPIEQREVLRGLTSADVMVRDDVAWPKRKA